MPGGAGLRRSLIMIKLYNSISFRMAQQLKTNLNLIKKKDHIRLKILDIKGMEKCINYIK